MVYSISTSPEGSGSPVDMQKGLWIGIDMSLIHTNPFVWNPQLTARFARHVMHKWKLISGSSAHVRDLFTWRFYRLGLLRVRSHGDGRGRAGHGEVHHSNVHTSESESSLQKEREREPVTWDKSTVKLRVPQSETMATAALSCLCEVFYWELCETNSGCITLQ